MTLDCTCNRLKEAEAKAAKWDGIVRCGECVFLKDEGCAEWPNHRLCMWWGRNTARGGFCAWGMTPDDYHERREDA